MTSEVSDNPNTYQAPEVRSYEQIMEDLLKVGPGSYELDAMEEWQLGSFRIFLQGEVTRVDTVLFKNNQLRKK
jgi:hypothetical protein